MTDVHFQTDRFAQFEIRSALLEKERKTKWVVFLPTFFFLPPDRVCSPRRAAFVSMQANQRQSGVYEFPSANKPGVRVILSPLEPSIRKSSRDRRIPHNHIHKSVLMTIAEYPQGIGYNGQRAGKGLPARID